MSTTPSPVPSHPPGPAREALLRYFADWPAGQRISAVKATEWSAARDAEDDDEDEDQGSAPPAPQRKRLPRSEKFEGGPGPDLEHVHETEWGFKQSARCAKAEWFVTTPGRWIRDPRSADPEWHAMPLNYSKVLVIRVSAV